MAYTIAIRDKDSGATYKAKDREEVLRLTRTFLEHGTKYHGDKIHTITITRDKGSRT